MRALTTHGHYLALLDTIEAWARIHPQYEDVLKTHPDMYRELTIEMERVRKEAVALLEVHVETVKNDMAVMEGGVVIQQV